MSIQPFEGKTSIQAGIVKAFDKALAINERMVIAHIKRLSKGDEVICGTELIGKLEREYLSAVSLLGAISGAAAAVPGFGTSASVVLSTVEIGTFFETSCLFALSLSIIHSTRVMDLTRRRTLILSLMLGNSAEGFIHKVVGRTAPHLGKQIVNQIPATSLKNINKVLGRDFVTKYGTKRGVVVLGTALPFGLGAALGATLNGGMGYGIVKSARRAFGPPPTQVRISQLGQG